MHACTVHTHAMGVVSLLAFSLLVMCSSIAAPSPSPSPPPPRKKVVVEGSVYCFFCVIEGGPGSVSKTALLPGAVVKLQCNNTAKGWEEETTTDNDGKFSFRPTKVSSWGAHKCRVFLVSSSRKDDCPIVDGLNNGDSGAILNKTTSSTSPHQPQLYSVGPFAFHPGHFMCL